MTNGLSLNQFAPNTPVKGQDCYLPNKPQGHNFIIGADEEEVLKNGHFVKLDATSTNTDAPVILGATDEDAEIFGVVEYNPVKNTHKAGDIVAVKEAGSYVWLQVAEDTNVVPGAVVYMADVDGTITDAIGTARVGRAITAPKADGLVQVRLEFGVDALTKGGVKAGTGIAVTPSEDANEVTVAVAG